MWRLEFHQRQWPVLPVLCSLVCLTLLTGCVKKTADSMPRPATKVEISDKAVDWQRPPEDLGSVSDPAGATEDPVKENPATQIYFATNRKNEGTLEAPSFDEKRSREVSYGVCDVELKPSENDSFLSEIVRGLAHRFWLIKTDPNDQQKYEATLIKTVLLQSERDFLSRITSAYGKGKQREILLFVHGYCNTFKDAQESAAKIAYNSKFEGVAVTFSWPTEGKELLYPVDRNNAYWSVAYLERFLKLLIGHKETRGIHIVAHSMGNEVLIRAVLMALSAKDESERRLFVSKIKSISIAAPDVDEDTFRDQFGAMLNQSGIKITVYASKNDRALKISEKLQRYTRLGRSVSWAADFARLDVVDASQAGTDWMGHAAVRTSRTLARDLSCTITGCNRSDQPFIKKVSGNNLWQLTPP